MVVATIRDVTERRRLDAELRKARELQQLVQERQRIGRELHDGSIQMLFALGMRLQALGIQMSDRQLAEQLDEAVTDIDEIIRDLRNYIFELRPGLLASSTLDQALKDLAVQLERETGVITTVDADTGIDRTGLSGRAGDVVQLAREALSNVGRHAQAQSCRVSMHQRDDILRLEIQDDGRGFDPARVSGTGWGLRNLRERLSALGGTVEIDSAPGQGTTVKVRIPCEASGGRPR
jgi:signal transduction histidine kinase